MTDENKLIPREPANNGTVEVISGSRRLPAIDLSPREPHLYDYLLILRKHQWLILTFLLTVVTIVSIATFRMRPVYVATATIEIDRENSNILPFQGADSYDFMMDLDNYIETQSKVLTSETLALQTIRNSGLAGAPEFSSGGVPSEAIANGLAGQSEATAGSGRFFGEFERQARAQHSPARGKLRIHGPRVCGQDSKRPPGELQGAEHPEPLRSHAGSHPLPHRPTQRTEADGEAIRRCAHQLRAAKPDLERRRQVQHHHANASPSWTSSSPTRKAKR